ncbi:hypothetical protein HGRIS_006038 [Hohenbuehelia grisea]|uniref:F-box domain-containing protein n=1 Tax=Hohenbuehelia grisea TaxID=104357 RepID=A0ABR3JZR9_9AGAR
MRIPYDVARLIVDELWSIDFSQQTLFSCTLVSSDWLLAARAIIFRRITLNSDNIRQFIALTSVDATFVSQTQKIVISGQGKTTITRVVRSLAQLHILADSPITTLVVADSCSLQYTKQRGAELVDRLASFIEVALPQITTLKLDAMKIPSDESLVTLTSSLPNVALLSVGDVAMESRQTVHLHAFPKLRVLKSVATVFSHHSLRFWRFLCSAETWPAIEDMRLTIIDEAQWTQPTLELLRKVSPSLTYLNLDYTACRPFDLRFPSFPVLRKLAAEFNCASLNIFPPSPVQMILPIAPVFSSIRAPLLEEITMTVILFFNEAEIGIPLMDWSEVDEILGQPQFSSLKLVKVVIYAEEPSKLDKDIIPRKMLTCHHKGILRVTFLRRNA